MSFRDFVIPVLLALLIPMSVSAQSLPEKLRGSYVCEKLPMTRDVLRTPLDMIIEGDKVLFARPLFNLNGRVVGSELARGSIDPQGRVHLTSQWSLLGNIARGDYSGTLTATGGTLTGTQTWTAPNQDGSLARACTAALVPAPRFRTASQQ
jgi:hypothetical protein